MRIYEFHFFDVEGRFPTLDLSDCASDGDAAREAFRNLNQHASCCGVDVYEGDRLVIRIQRPAGTDLPDRPAIHGA